MESNYVTRNAYDIEAGDGIELIASNVPFDVLSTCISGRSAVD